MHVDQRQPPSDAAPDSPSGGLADRLSPVGGATSVQWWSPLWRFVVADVSALAAAAALSGVTSAFALWATAAVIMSLRMSNLYRRAIVPTALAHAGGIAMGAAAGSLAAAALAGTTAPRAAAFATLASPLLLAGRAIAYARHRAAARRHPQRAIVVGTGCDGQELVSRLADHPEHGVLPLGFVDTHPLPIDPNLEVGVLGELRELRTIIERLHVNRIFLDTASVSEVELLDVLDRAAALHVEISVVPALAQHLSTSIAAEGIAGATVLSYRPSRHHGVSWSVKRAIDVVGALIMLLVSAPVWLLAAIAIKLDSSGPVLYKQTRVGRHGKAFTIYKLRSMVRDADSAKTRYLDLNEASGPYFKICGDPRVTRVGRVIRRCSIDEIPQVLNVIRGDMSLVGPRPALASEVAEYPDWFRRRLTVRPGLTGLWQVSGRFLVPFAEATQLDVSYVDHWSLALDLQILARTPAVVLSGRGAR